MDHGSCGVAWLQTSVDQTQAVLEVTAQISNGTKKKIPLTLVARVLDAEGKTVASVERPSSLAPEATEPHSVRVMIPTPHLWHGRKDPYLHRAIVELREQDGVRDSVAQPLGLRSFRVDPDKGFFLNGEPYHLHGVTDVKIYSNAKEVELLLNGATQGRHTNDGNAVFVWKNLQLNPGENIVAAKAECNGTQLSDRCTWNFMP